MNEDPRHTRSGLADGTTALWLLGSPRRLFWGLLTGALSLSLALPLLILWQTSAAGLQAHACMWPAEPRAGASAQVLVVIPASEANRVRDGAPSVQVEAEMPGIAMPAAQASDNAPPERVGGADVFATPITVSMPGTWVAHVTVRALGRPVWRETFTFHARSDGWNDLPLSTQSASAATLCGASQGPPDSAQRAGQTAQWET